MYLYPLSVRGAKPTLVGTRITGSWLFASGGRLQRLATSGLLSRLRIDATSSVRSSKSISQFP
jgi:hypothetical protein